MAASDRPGLKRVSSYGGLALFLVGVLGTGIAIGSLTDIGDWYLGLQKPAFNPPNWVFGPVWSILYIMIAVAGWRVFHLKPNQRLWWIWCGQMGLNFAWTPLFFALHLLWPALMVLIALVWVILAFVATAWRQDRISSWLFLPYAVWVGFAGLLNASIAGLN